MVLLVVPPVVSWAALCGVLDGFAWWCAVVRVGVGEMLWDAGSRGVWSFVWGPVVFFCGVIETYDFRSGFLQNI